MIRGRVYNGVVRLDEALSLPEGAEVRVELVRPSQPPSAIALLDEWLQDQSGYDEEAWPKLKSEVDEDRSSAGRGDSLMAKQVLLDAGPLGMISHPRPNKVIAESMRRLLSASITVRVPEIADYEVRRELLRANRQKGIQRLDDLKAAIGYVPITTATMLKAAEFWAASRKQGFPTADDVALDADVILAAQAMILETTGDDVVIVTTNVGHLTHFADARKWTEINESDLL